MKVFISVTDCKMRTYKLCAFICLLMICSLGAAASINYPGKLHVYLLFCIVANALLLNGFRSSSLFFDTFIGVFLWLGFWFKFSVKTAFGEGYFFDALGFDRTPAAYDSALIVSSCGLAGFLVASFVRKFFFVYPNQDSKLKFTATYVFYKRNRRLLLSTFFFVVAIAAISNVAFGIYQRGVVGEKVRQWWLVGTYSWLLQFGLASMVSIVIRFEIELNGNLTLIGLFCALFEGVVSSVSMLSRASLINMAAIAFGVLKTIKNLEVKINVIRLIMPSILVVIFIGGSIVLVNYMRAVSYGAVGSSIQEIQQSIKTVQHMTQPLIVDRWVGIESVVAVSSSNKLGWSLWEDAWSERPITNGISLYDRQFIDTPYKSSNRDGKFNFVTLPGIVAFLYYPGYVSFLFGATFLVALLSAAIEIMSYKFSNSNLMMSSLIAEVVAYRLAHFGYLPSQSYWLVLAIFFNIGAIYFTDFVLRKFYKCRSWDQSI